MHQASATSRSSHQFHKLLPLASKARIIICIQMSDENLICDLAHLLHQVSEFVPFHAVRHRVDHGAQLAAITIRDFLKQLSPLTLQERLVGCLKDHSRISRRQVAGIRNRAGIVDDLVGTVSLAWKTLANGGRPSRSIRTIQTTALS